MVNHLLKRVLLTSAVAALTVASVAVPAGAAVAGGSGQEASSSYLVVLKQSDQASGVRAIGHAGGKMLKLNKLGIATATSSDPAFASTLRSSGAVEEVGSDGGWQLQPLSITQVPPPVSGPEMAADCAAQYGVSVAVGPDQLSACQWDMRAINSSPAGSYAVNRGAGATIGIIDTGVDFTHPDIAPNLDLGLSCSFITPGNPTALPEEIDPTGPACQTKSATQDLFGHGTHVAGIAAAPINGIGVAGVAPAATLVSLKVCTAGGLCFTQEVVDALVYAGDKGLDVANMSLFADPFLFNCRNQADQRAIVKAISRATQYASQHGVVVVAAAGNEATDLAHPVTDETSPDFPPGAAVTRNVGNQCVVLPQELPGVATVSAIGPQATLSFYSNFGNAAVDATAPGGSSGQAPNPFGRVLNAWGSRAPRLNTTLRRLVEDCAPVAGKTVCALYGWIQGTSMASPHAAGVAALIRAAHPGMPPSAVIARLQNTAMPMVCEEQQDPLAAPRECTGGQGHTNFYGSGLVDALAAGQR
jgi:lantibiotic leader peptide-processing serine protease